MNHIEQAKENFSKKEIDALELIIKKEYLIDESKREIEKILQANNLSKWDLNKYKQYKTIDKFLASDLP